jgi:hypothetical protein
MAVDVKLLLALQKKLGLSRSQVNRRIADEANGKHLPRKLAAISLASQNRLPIHRFATDDELAQLRGLPHHHGLPSPQQYLTRPT